MLELDQYFFVELSGNRISADASVARVTITDNDVNAADLPAGPDPSSGPGDGEIVFEELRYAVSEGAGNVTLVAVLSGAIPASENVSVSVTTIDGSATVDGGDYTETTLTLQFTSNVRRLPVSVSILGDTVVERDEVFRVKLSGDGVSSVASIAMVTVSDDDRGVVSVTPGLPSVAEGRMAIFMLELGGDVTADESIDVSWSVVCGDGSGVTSEDFADSSCPSGMVTISSGETSATFAVSTSDDDVVEGLEEFDLTLTDVVPNIDGRITISATMSTASVTITDNDAPVPDIPVEIGFEELSYRVSEGAGIVTLVAVLSGAISSSENVSVVVTTMDGTAVAIEDYGQLGGTLLTFTADMPTRAVSVLIEDDLLLELDQYFFVELSGERVSSDASVARVTITDNDVDAADLPAGPDPSSGPGDGEIVFEKLRYDVSEGAGNVTLVAVLSGAIPASENVIVSVTTINGIATVDGGDYTETTLTFQFTSNVRRLPVAVSILDDVVVEGSEVFEVKLSGERVSSVASIAMVTVSDDDRGVVSVTSGLPSVTEGRMAIFTLELGGDVTADESIDVLWSIVCGDGSGVTSEDFADSSCPSGMVTISSGETSATFAVSTSDDDVVEGLEEFDLTLTDVVPNIDGRITISATMSTASVTILANDGVPPVVPAVEIGFEELSYRVSEGAGSVTLVAVLSGAISSSENVSVVVTTMDGTAVAIEDYGQLGGTLLTFTADMPTRAVSVSIEDDLLLELDQYFFVELSGERVSSDASVARVTITDNDVDAADLPAGPDPSSGPGDGEIVFEELRYDVSEGAGSVTLVAVLSGAISSSENVSVIVTTIDGIATVDGGDYTDTTLTLQFTSNVRRLPVSVSILDDVVVEGSEVFEVKLSGERVSSVASIARVTVSDDDRGVVSVMVVTDTVSEGAEVGFIVNLSGDVTADESIDVSWRVNCGAGSGVTSEDFADSSCPSGVVTISSGETSATFAVSTSDDDVVEGLEEFDLTLTDVVPNIDGRITISENMSTAVVTILANDGVLPVVPAVEIGFEELSYSVSEGAGSVTLVAVLSGAISSSENVSVVVTTMDGTAVAVEDYGQLEGTLLTFTADMPTRAVSVVIEDDMLLELDQYFFVELSGERVSSDASVARVTITDNDAPVPDIPVEIGFEELSYRVSEGAGSVTLSVSVLFGSIDGVENVSVVVTTMDGTAVAGDDGDYTGIGKILTFTASESVQTVEISILDDDVLEREEEFYVILSATDGIAKIASPQTAVVRILPDDEDRVSIGFTRTSYNVSENEGTLILTLRVLDGEIADGVSVSVTTVLTGIVDEGDLDNYFALNGAMFTFSSGNTSHILTIRITDDDLYEYTEQLNIALISGDAQSVVLSDPSVITILDEDNLIIGFTSSPSHYVVDELNGISTISVAILAGQIAPSVTVSIGVATADGTAEANRDYFPLMNGATISFTAEILTRLLELRIVNDDLTEGAEYFEVTLSHNLPRISLSPSVARITIINAGDNTPPRRIEEPRAYIAIAGEETLIDLSAIFTDDDLQDTPFYAAVLPPEIGTLSNAVLRLTPVEPGILRVAVTVTDESGGMLKDTLTVEVHDNTFCEDAATAGILDVPFSECQSLRALYLTSGGPHWLDNSGWLRTSAISSWSGVTVTVASDGFSTSEVPTLHVTELDLGSNRLSGEISSFMGSLTHLNYLDLSGNSLTGHIPPDIADLGVLRTLNLSGNLLSGDFPSFVIYMDMLEGLILNNNTDLGGIIPEDIKLLLNLEALKLHSTNIKGVLPYHLCNKPGLADAITFDEIRVSCAGPETFIPQWRIPNSIMSTEGSLISIYPTVNIIGFDAIPSAAISLDIRGESGQTAADAPYSTTVEPEGSWSITISDLMPGELYAVNVTQALYPETPEGMNYGLISEPSFRNIEVSTTSTTSQTTLVLDDLIFTEGGQVGTITVTLYTTDVIPLTISVLVVDDSTTYGSDYTSPNGTLYFSVSGTSSTFTLGIIDDDLYEENENFVLAFFTEDGNLLTTAVATITDDETPIVTFSSPSYVVEEGTNSVILDVVTSSDKMGSFNKSIAVSIVVNGITAIAGEDFTNMAIPDEIVFEPQNNQRNFRIFISDDTIVEMDETFEVSLLIDGAHITKAIVTIRDNDFLYAHIEGPDDPTVKEGEPALFTIGIDSAEHNGVRIYWDINCVGTEENTRITESDIWVEGENVFLGQNRCEGWVVIPEGDTSTILRILPTQESASSVLEQTEEFTITLIEQPESSQFGNVLVTIPSFVEAAIIDNPPINTPPTPPSPPSPRPPRNDNNGGGGGDDDDDVSPIILRSVSGITVESFEDGNPEFSDRSSIEEITLSEIVTFGNAVQPPPNVSLPFIVDLSLIDARGNDIDTLRRPARICFPVPSAPGSVDTSDLRIYRLTENLDQWVILENGIYDAESRKYCAQFSEVSIYALGVGETDILTTPPALLPPTGGYMLEWWLFSTITFIGFLILIIGIRTILRIKRRKQEDTSLESAQMGTTLKIPY